MQTTLHTEFVGIFIVYLHTKSHVQISGSCHDSHSTINLS